MKAQRKKKPESFCTKCGTPHAQLPEFGSVVCRTPAPGGRQCGGTLRSAIAIGAWCECMTCRGTGRNGRALCGGCSGVGFHLERQWA